MNRLWSKIYLVIFINFNIHLFFFVQLSGIIILIVQVYE